MSGGRKRIYRHAPRPLVEGACPVCHRVIGATATGRRRFHRNTTGEDCEGSGVRIDPVKVTAEMLSEARIVIPPPPKPPAPRIKLKKPRGKGVRPRPIGACHECGRAVTGERLYCGPCVVERGR